MNLRSRKLECKSGKPNDVKKPASTEATAGMPKFSLQLTDEEIKEDFIKMTGQAPKKRPNKRPRAVQKNLDTLVTGMGLIEGVTADMYKVDDESPEQVNEKGKDEDEDESI